MASSGAVRAGKAYVELFSDGTALTRGLKASEAALKGFGKKIGGFGKQVAATAMGYLSADALKSVAKSVIDTGTVLANMSARTGASVTALQTLGYAADRTGASMDDVAGAMTHIRDQIAAAAAGSDEALVSFARLGIDFGKLSKMKPEDQFRMIAKAINEIPHPAQKAYFATKLLGNADLVPLVGQLDVLEQKANDLGIVMDDETAAAAKEFSNSMKDLWAICQNVAVTIAGALAPAAKYLVGVAIDVATAVRDWIAANVDLQAGAESISAAFKVAWARTKVVWAEAIGGLEIMWLEFKTSCITVAIELGQSIANALVSAMEIVAKAWPKVFSGIIKGILIATSMIQRKSIEISEAEKMGYGMAADIIVSKITDGTVGDHLRAGIDDMAKGAISDVRAAADKDLKGLYADMDKARADLDTAIADSKKKKAAAGEKGKEKASGNAADLMGMASSVTGTFSARAVSGFSKGGMTVFNAIKQATVQTAQNTAQILRKPGGIGIS